MGRILFRGFELLLGAAHFVDKFLKPGVIFFAGLRFQAAGDVDPIRTNNPNGLRNVFDLQAAGQNDTVRSSGAAGEIPVSCLARGAPLSSPPATRQKNE